MNRTTMSKTGTNERNTCMRNTNTNMRVRIVAFLFAALIASRAWAQDKVTPDEARVVGAGT